MALVEKLVNGTDPAITIQKHENEPELFQYILRAGRTFKGVSDGEHLLEQKVNRVFAVNEDVPHVKLYKQRQDGGLVNFPDAPERMYVWNDDCSKLTNFSQLYDMNHYLSIVLKKLEGWS
jgi:hypothetical protein